MATDRMPKDRVTEAREDTGATAVGRNSDWCTGGVKDRRLTVGAVAVMPLWDRPCAGACR